MARTTITAVEVDDTGYNLTDSADFTALLGTGSPNGVQFLFDKSTIVVLKNIGLGNPSLWTITLKTNSEIEEQGGSVVDPTVTIATNKTHIIKPVEIFRELPDDMMFVDCDFLNEVLVLKVS